jgi:hypothetical protein
VGQSKLEGPVPLISSAVDIHTIVFGQAASLKAPFCVPDLNAAVAAVRQPTAIGATNGITLSLLHIHENTSQGAAVGALGLGRHRNWARVTAGYKSPSADQSTATATAQCCKSLTTYALTALLPLWLCRRRRQLRFPQPLLWSLAGRARRPRHRLCTCSAGAVLRSSARQAAAVCAAMLRAWR